MGGKCEYIDGVPGRAGLYGPAPGAEPAVAAVGNGEPECGESIECGRGDAAAPALSPSPGLCAALPYDGVRGLPIASAAEFGAGLGGNAGVYGPGVGMGVVCGEKVPLRGVPAYEP